MLNEELLFVWLQLGNVIDNQRLVAELPFNEDLTPEQFAAAGLRE